MNKNSFVLDSNTRWDYKISFYVVFYFIAEITNATIKTVLDIPDSIWMMLSLLFGALIMFFMFRCIREVFRRRGRVFRNSLLLFVLLYAVSYIMILSRNEPTQAFWSGNVLLSFAYWIPIGVSASSIEDKKILYDTFYKWSYLLSILLFLCVFFRRSTELMEGEVEYNMFFGFHLVIPALFHISEYLRTRKKGILAFFLLEVVLIVVYANRGALIPLVVYFVFMLVINGKKQLQDRIINLLVIVLVASFVFVLSKPLLSVMSDISSAMGVRSRTLEMLANGELSNPTGRDELSTIAWKMINERPILGWGLGGEHYQIAVEMTHMPQTVTKVAFTPHNGILEFLVSFGLFAGAFATILFIIPLFRQRAVRDYYSAMMIVIFGSAIIAPGMISADGILIKPGAAIYLYLYLTRNS